MTNVETVVQRILDREHMPVPQDIGDGAGLTGAGGQTQAWCSTWNVPFPETEGEAAANLVVWLAKVGLMPLVTASAPLGDAIADIAYNQGLRTGIRALQTVLGALPVDGVMGPVTIAAVNACPDLSALVRDATIYRFKALGQALANREVDPKFAPGLINRYVSFL